MYAHKTYKSEKIGEKIGYLFSYFLFTTILYYILTLLNKIPSNWNYINIMAITLVVCALAIIIKRGLK